MAPLGALCVCLCCCSLFFGYLFCFRCPPRLLLVVGLSSRVGRFPSSFLLGVCYVSFLLCSRLLVSLWPCRWCRWPCACLSFALRCLFALRLSLRSGLFSGSAAWCVCLRRWSRLRLWFLVVLVGSGVGSPCFSRLPPWPSGPVRCRLCLRLSRLALTLSASRFGGARFSRLRPLRGRTCVRLRGCRLGFLPRRCLFGGLNEPTIRRLSVAYHAGG